MPKLNNGSIANRFSKLILSMLTGVLLFTVCVTSVMEVASVARQQHESLKDQAFNTLNLIDLQLNTQQSAIVRTAQSQLSINSLVDLGAGSSYFQYALEDLTLYTAIEDPHLFDYAGRIILSHDDDKEWFKPDMVEAVLVSGKGKTLLRRNHFYIIEPIIYYGAVQGGIIAHVDLDNLLTPFLSSLDSLYTLTVGNNLTFTNIVEKTPGVSVSVSQIPGMRKGALPITLTLTTPYFNLLKDISSWLINFSLLALLTLLPVIIIARRLGKKMARPIVELADKVKQGNYPIESPYESSELTSLAQAFNQATEHIRKASESTIQEERRSGLSQVHAIVDTVVDGIVTIDNLGFIATFNPAAEGLFGYTASEVIGEKVNILMPHNYSSQHDQFLTNYLSGKPAKVIGIGREITARRKNGTVFPAELAVSEMRINGKRMFTGVIRDITERKKDEAVKNEFVATVSHELRTPLTSIRGALGLILGKFGDELSEKNKKMLTLALRNSERLTLLINDILDIEKLESGQLTLTFTRINLDTIVRRSIEDNESYASQHNVDLVLDSQVQEAFVNADSIRLQQVMANLLSNAIKYSRPGEAVTVSLKHLSNGYRVEVIDVGTGIPPEYHEKIFERFSQADSSDTRRVGGTGLGLAISKAIVEGHQGTLEFFSELGKGSTFYFTLPSESASGGWQDDSPALQVSGYQILYFGSNEKILSQFRQSFSSICDVSHAGDLPQALLATSKQPFNLLVLEWPVKADEREVIKIFNKQPVPIVLLSHGDKPFPHPERVIAICNQSKCNMTRLKSELRLILKNTFPREVM